MTTNSIGNSIGILAIVISLTVITMAIKDATYQIAKAITTNAECICGK